jgi:hypothetical protein
LLGCRSFYSGHTADHIAADSRCGLGDIGRFLDTTATSYRLTWT